MYFFSCAHLEDMSPKYAYLTFFTYEPRTRYVIDEWKKYMGICISVSRGATVQISDQLKHYSPIYSIANIKYAHLGTLLYICLRGEPNECLVHALWKVGSSFDEALNEAASKGMANAFSLKYQLVTNSVRSASVCSTNDQTQFALLLWHAHICMIADACLASFKCGYGLIWWCRKCWFFRFWKLILPELDNHSKSINRSSILSNLKNQFLFSIFQNSIFDEQSRYDRKIDQY